VRGAVWAVLGILALNVLLVGVLLVAVAVQRFRSTRAQRRLEVRWRIPKLPSAAATRHRGRRFAYAALGVAVLWAFAGLVGLGPTHAVTSAVSTMVHGSDTSDGFQSRSIEPVGDGSAHQHDRRTAAGSGVSDPNSPAPDTVRAAGGSPSGGDLGAPSTVAAVSASPSSIRLKWTDVPAASGYQIFRSTGTEIWLAVATTNPGTTTYVDDGLSSATTYFYRVVAVTDTGTAPPSDVVSATTSAPPLVATTLTCSSTTSDAIDLAWTDVDGETGYRIERSTDGVSDWTTIATTGQDVTAYTDAGLAAGTTYSFRVFVENEAGESPASNVASATTAPQQPPASGEVDTAANVADPTADLAP
jgi:fibronectin type III domain protein